MIIHISAIVKTELRSCLINGGLECKGKGDFFNVTTHINVRLTILPLTKRCGTDILSQKMRRLSVQFYIDTLFNNGTSVQGNKCDHLYSDGDEFLHVFPMSSNARVGDSMGNAVKDIFIMN